MTNCVKAGGAGEELGHIHCYAGCAERFVPFSEVLREPARRWLSALSSACRLPSCVGRAPCRLRRRPGAAGGREGAAGSAEQRRGKMGTAALSRGAPPASASLCVCVCVVLLFRSRRKRQNSFQLSYTETGTSESGLAKLMCRKALGVNLKRWVEAVMHMIKVKHAAYTENC